MPKRDLSRDPANLKAMWKKARPVYTQLKKAGLSNVVIAALLGNIALESSFNPDARAGSYWGYILNQKEIVDWVIKNFGGYKHDHLMNYLIAGLTGKLPEVTSLWGKDLKGRFDSFNKGITKNTTVAQATALWEKHYEKSGGQQLSKRINYANYFYDLIINESKPNKKSKKTAAVDYDNINSFIQNYNIFSPEQLQEDLKDYYAENTKTDFDLPLVASSYKSGGKILKRHLYGGTLASRYIKKYFDPNNPLVTYVNFDDAKKAGLQFTNNINDPYSGAFFSYEISDDLLGVSDYNRPFTNNILGYKINPLTTFVAITPDNKIINNSNYDVVINGQNLIPTTGYVFDGTRGWIPAPTQNGQIIDLDMLDQAELAARFLSDRGFEHAWRMDPTDRINFARSVQESDAAGEALIFGTQIPGAASSAYRWLTGTNAGRALTTSMLAGQAYDTGTEMITGQPFGEYFAGRYGGSPFLWGLANPGYLLGEGLLYPVKELGEPLIKDASKSLLNELINAGKRIFSKESRGNLQSSFEIGSSLYVSSLPERIEEASNYVKEVTDQGFKNAKIYTPEEALRIRDLLVAEHIILPGVNDDITIIGLTPINNKMNLIINNLQKYRLFNYYEPLLPFNNILENGKLVDFRVPKQTYFIIDESGNTVLKNTRSAKEYVDDLINWPVFLSHIPKAKMIRGQFKDFLHSKAAFAYGALSRQNLIPSVLGTSRHEVLGHGMNELSKSVMDKEGNVFALLLENIVKELNPEVLKVAQLFFSGKTKGIELLALFTQTYSPIIRDLIKTKNLNIDTLLKLSLELPAKLLLMIDDYIDRASAEQLSLWFNDAANEYGDFVNCLLPTKKGISYAFNHDTYNIFLDMAVDSLKRKRISYTEKDALEFMNKIKSALKKGFSIVGISQILEAQNQDYNEYAK